jgi:ABC-type molybdate transport system permease subunit
MINKSKISFIASVVASYAVAFLAFKQFFSENFYLNLLLLFSPIAFGFLLVAYRSKNRTIESYEKNYLTLLVLFFLIFLAVSLYILII